MVLKDWVVVIAACVAAIFSFINLLVTWRNKKKEIRYANVQQQRIEHIKAFFKSCNTFNNSLQSFHSGLRAKVEDTILIERQNNNLEKLSQVQTDGDMQKLFLNDEDTRIMNRLLDNASLAAMTPVPPGYVSVTDPNALEIISGRMKKPATGPYDFFKEAVESLEVNIKKSLF